MVRPTFICIGVQKSGTTSLINYLSQHPKIFMKQGESHFFDTCEFGNYEKKQNNLTSDSVFCVETNYSGLYHNKEDFFRIEYEDTFITDKIIVGEKTPSYNYLRFAMDRIYNYNPNIKLILILREPISRAFSQYNMELNFNGKTLNDVTEEQIIKDFEKQENIKLSELKSNGSYYIIRGKYDEIIEYILSKFQRENIYIGISEEIMKNKQKYYNDIIHFLGAERINNINENVDTHIRKYNKNIPNILEQKLYRIYKPHNERLYKILGRRIDIWEKYYDKLKSQMT